MHVLITGGASGLGLGCARRFLARGDRVTIADVDAAGGTRALGELNAGSRARFEPVDLADPASITSLSARLLAEREPVDVLVNNAGIYPPSRRTLTAEGHELCFAIAHLGHFRLTRALWPLLPEAASTRVISISSLVQRRATIDLDDLSHERGYTPIRAYAQAKLACLLFALELQRRLERRASLIRSYAAHPGVCRTQLGHNRPIGPNDTRLQRMASATLGALLSRFGQSPELGAQSVLDAATTTTLPAGSFIGPTGLLEMSGPPGMIAPGPAARDPGLAAALWQKTGELAGSPWNP